MSLPLVNKCFPNKPQIDFAKVVHGRKKPGDVQKSLLESYVVTFLAFNVGDHFSSWNDPAIGGNQRFEQTRTEQSH
jgi:hypothetical protein